MTAGQTFASVTRGRLNNFDFFRLLFALVVIWSHSFWLSGLHHGPDPIDAITGGRLYLGGVAVNGFFLISGFLITASWMQRGNLLAFLRNRFLRIYPAFLVVSVLCGLVIGPLFADDAAAYWASFRPLAFLESALSLGQLAVPDSFQHNVSPGQINGSLWTIKIEFECYLAVAVLGLLGLLRRRWVPLGALVLLVITMALPTMPSPLQRAAFQIEFGIYFFSGMCFYLYRDLIPHSRLAFVASAVLLAGGLFASLAHPALAIFGGYCLFYLAFTPRLRMQHVARRMDLSYGLYLFGWPVGQLLMFWAAPALNPVLLFLTTSVVTALVAAASWFVIERPSLRLKDARLPQIASRPWRAAVSVTQAR